MRILHLIPNLSGGGAERQLSYLAPELASHGHEVHVAYHLTPPDGTACRDHERAGVALHRLPCAGNHDPRLLLSLLRLVRRVHPDVMQSWILQSDVLAAIVAKWSRVPWIMRESSSAATGAPKGLKVKLRAVLAAGASAIVANSRTGMQSWQARFPQKPVHVIRNGFPVERIAAQRNFSAALPEWFESGVRYILFAGRFHPVKNVRALVAAMPYLPSDIKLVLCGTGPLRPEYEVQIQGLGLGSRVVMPGEVPKEQVWALMREAHLLALLSHYEGSPNVLVEAMLNRCPLVVSDVPPHRELLDDGTAHFVNKDDAADIARGIRAALQPTRENADRTHRAFYFAGEFSIQRMSGEYAALYDRLLFRQDRSTHDNEQGPHHRLFRADRLRGMRVFRLARLRGTRRR